MRKNFCDRCAVQVVNIPSINDQVWLLDRHYDLCTSCKTDLVDWMGWIKADMPDE